MAGKRAGSSASPAPVRYASEPPARSGVSLMGLFRKDPAELLARAEKLIGRQEAVRTFELLAPLREDPDPEVRARAAALEDRAHAAVLDAALERAADAESDGELAEAADWLSSALEHCQRSGERAELEGRRASLLTRAAEKRQVSPGMRVWIPPSLDPEPEDGAEPDEEPIAGRPSGGGYALLPELLTEEAAARYAGRPRRFREACRAIQEGRPEEAREALEELLAEAPEEPVYRLERGRCRLMLGDAAGARDDLEAVWPSFGDAPLDRAGQFSVPALWADALLDLGEPEPILERLRDLARPAAGNVPLIQPYFMALNLAGEVEAARDYLVEAAGFYPNDSQLAFGLAFIHAKLGEARTAIAILERLVAPSFDGSERPPEVAALRLLASLYLDEGGPLDVVGGLLRRATEGRAGRLESEDYRLLARYQEAAGDAEGARRAEEAAERLEAREE
jgi:tetratricopeptide (TPR) repeat protein